MKTTETFIPRFEYHFETGKVVYSSTSLSVIDIATLIARFGNLTYCGTI